MINRKGQNKMNTYQIVDANGTAITGALTYQEAQRYMQTNRLNRTEYSIQSFMPGRERSTNAKETPSFKAMMERGIEFTGSTPGSIKVRFPSEQLALEIKASLRKDGFKVASCGNPSWIEIVKTW
jgi:hypothetical protein